MNPRDPEIPDFHEEDYSSEGFTEWKEGKSKPFSFELVEVILRDGTIGEGLAAEFTWTIDLVSDDITWYRRINGAYHD
jgi:hypothetical protein